MIRPRRGLESPGLHVLSAFSPRGGGRESNQPYTSLFVQAKAGLPGELTVHLRTLRVLSVNAQEALSADREGEERLFEGEEWVLHVIERTVAPLGHRVDGSSPWVDARLPVGSRVTTEF